MLAAALIVRNEATEIAACLDSLADLDRIVLVDTGSDDDTIAIAETWAAGPGRPPVQIAHFAWMDDFAAARNQAHARAVAAGAEWVLHFDADMRLCPGGAARLRAACAVAHGRTLAVLQESNAGQWCNRRVLCLRRGVSWVGAIHEAAEADDGETAAGVVVRYGWSDSHHRDPDRNLRILQAEAGRDATPRTCYYLGTELWEKGRLDEAAAWFRRCADSSTWRAERADAWLYIAKILWQQQRGDEAREACLRSLVNVPDCAEALDLMAAMSWPEQAATWRKFAATANNEGVIFIRPPARRGVD